jgi:DNA-binding Xre family transcriptional regulator|tara:strand:- start:56360 stop:56611 length:252 start_codon:yes stop_codon:yes gene_type:complete
MGKIKETKLKKLLAEKRISQTDLFNLIKKHCKTYLGKDVISRIVNGKKTNYEINTLLKICYVLSCSPNQLIEKEQFINTQIKK